MPQNIENVEPAHYRESLPPPFSSEKEYKVFYCLMLRLELEKPKFAKKLYTYAHLSTVQPFRGKIASQRGIRARLSVMDSPEAIDHMGRASLQRRVASVCARP